MFGGTRRARMTVRKGIGYRRAPCRRRRSLGGEVRLKSVRHSSSGARSSTESKATLHADHRQGSIVGLGIGQKYDTDLMSPHSAKEKPGVETALEWSRRARLEWDPVFFRERRFGNPWGDVDLLAQVQSARDWLVSNPAPDEQLARNIDAMLDAYFEMPTATVSRLQELREIIDHHARAILEWEAAL
jgi:hypothetical protein